MTFSYPKLLCRIHKTGLCIKRCWCVASDMIYTLDILHVKRFWQLSDGWGQMFIGKGTYNYVVKEYHGMNSWNACSFNSQSFSLSNNAMGQYIQYGQYRSMWSGIVVLMIIPSIPDHIDTLLIIYTESSCCQYSFINSNAVQCLIHNTFEYSQTRSRHELISMAMFVATLLP